MCSFCLKFVLKSAVLRRGEIIRTLYSWLIWLFTLEDWGLNSYEWILCFICDNMCFICNALIWYVRSDKSISCNLLGENSIQQGFDLLLDDFLEMVTMIINHNQHADAKGFVLSAGNLGRVDYINDFEFDLFIRPDTCNPRFRVWFNFTVENVRETQVSISDTH